MTLAATPVQAQEVIDSRREYNVKAVSLYAFGRYVTWPPASFESETSEFRIGVYGPDPFGETLDRIAQKKKIQERPIRVWEVKTPEEGASCHILFVTRATPPEVEARLIAALEGKSVLLVGETPGFAERGGAINFFVHGSNVRFELNADRAMANRLSLNAKMHSLGTPVSTNR
ncbi:hypothetical protein Mal64_33070 [Pseudobythopirellula maris]|uniref:DUF4154 domain-containing protein n=2 Tax=Pseudobythopirellula maris TaxID=2527991 RepID=A0A5C5ZGL6_9BACT|nr:hypothetical protein Mal64_33070 [Pseudobythopirellula maris]